MVDWAEQDKIAGMIQQLTDAIQEEVLTTSEVRSGRWKGTKEYDITLPTDVQDRIEEIQDSDEDWMMFTSGDGQQWLIAKLWEYEEHFTIVAAIIKKEIE
jgi:hypothetical protein